MDSWVCKWERSFKERWMKLPNFGEIVGVDINWVVREWS